MLYICPIIIDDTIMKIQTINILSSKRQFSSWGDMLLA